MLLPVRRGLLAEHGVMEGWDSGAVGEGVGVGCLGAAWTAGMRWSFIFLNDLNYLEILKTLDFHNQGLKAGWGGSAVQLLGWGDFPKQSLAWS